MLPPDPRDADRPDEPTPAPFRWRRPGTRALAWGGFGAFLIVLVLYLVGPTFRYGANLSPPGPAAWDQPQAKPRPAAAAPAPSPVIQAAPLEEPAGNATVEENDAADADSADTSLAPPAAPDEADMLRAIDRARFKALDSGDAKHWEGGGHEGYVVPSAPVVTGERECRNLVVTIFTDGGQPRSSTDRYCRDDEDAEWAPQ